MAEPRRYPRRPSSSFAFLAPLVALLAAGNAADPDRTTGADIVFAVGAGLLGGAVWQLAGRGGAVRRLLSFSFWILVVLTAFSTVAWTDVVTFGPAMWTATLAIVCGCLAVEAFLPRQRQPVVTASRGAAPLG